MHGTLSVDHLKEAQVNEPEKPELPTFKARWWYRTDRLDARPVIWSLYNRPDEWQMTGSTITHTASQHQFWVVPHMGYRLYAPHCGCSSNGGKFQHFQARALGRAIRWWRFSRGGADRFASHFVH